MIDKQIYSSYAFTKNEREKGTINGEIYRDLLGKHLVFRHDTKFLLKDGDDCHFDDFDVVIGRKPGYHHAIYRIYKNEPSLTTPELALLCDLGNLCFGYSMEGADIRVSED